MQAEKQELPQSLRNRCVFSYEANAGVYSWGAEIPCFSQSGHSKVYSTSVSVRLGLRPGLKPGLRLRPRLRLRRRGMLRLMSELRPRKMLRLRLS